MKKKHTYVLSLFANAAMAMLLVWGCKKEEPVKLATLSTLSVTDITKNTAKSGGNITNDGGGEITSRGVVWSLSQNPTIEQNLGYTLNIPGTGQFASEISDLTRYTKYYVRAYATNKAGVAYGNELDFTTEGEPSVITTEPITSITAISAVCGGNITDDGGAPITTRGVIWSNSQNPTVESNLGITSNGTGIGSFTSELTNLAPNLTYYIRSFATNSLGTYYGDEFDFTTRDGICTITTTTVSNITISSAQTGGNITEDGGSAVTARGVVWSTTQNPTIEANLGFTSSGTGTGSFTSNLTGLSLGVTYFVRAYATNSVGTTYGNQQTFTTLDGIIDLTTSQVSSITLTTANSGGNITNDGGAAVTARGVVWSTLQNPTTTSNQGITSNGTGTGNYTSNLTGLIYNTTYYVRAYATNSVGTIYGNQQTFTTRDGAITLLTITVTSITGTTAISGGYITSDGGAAVTDRGVVWSTSQNPTTTTNQGITSNGTGTGSFSSNLTGLSQATTYYVRAYATNSYETHYGNQISFTTNTPDGPGGTITDIDGNVYNTIWINGRQWTKENLKTTKFNDGTNIPLVTNNNDWSWLDTPAYCWYDNNQSTFGNLYGALYNWGAVDSDKLCPTNWHVPTDSEWYAMENYVDPTIDNPNTTGWRGTDGGIKLRTTSGWYDGGNGSDDFGFSALPGGFRRDNDGDFESMGNYGCWWSSTADYGTEFWCRAISFDYEGVDRNFYFYRQGFSVRCVKD